MCDRFSSGIGPLNLYGPDVSQGLRDFDLQANSVGVWWALSSLAWRADVTRDPAIRDQFLAFVQHVRDFFPCESCRTGFARFMQTRPPDLAHSYFDWVYHIRRDSSASLPSLYEMRRAYASRYK